MYDLSVCLAAIRKENWARLYNSVVKSAGEYSFEMIFCGPHDELPPYLVYRIMAPQQERNKYQ